MITDHIRLIPAWADLPETRTDDYADRLTIDHLSTSASARVVWIDVARMELSTTPTFPSERCRR